MSDGNQLIVANSESLSARPDNLPAFIQHNEGLIGVEALLQYIRPPMLKIVQPQSKPELKAQFQEGDVLVMPQKELVAEIQLNANNRPSDNGTPFIIVPIFFYVEWITWNPLAAAGVLTPIRERSQDPNSIVARKAKNPQTRKELCPEFPKNPANGDPCYISHTEHLNYLVSIVSNETLFDTPVTMGFCRSEHQTGMNFNAAIRMRKTHIFANQFMTNTSRRQNQQGSWFGYNIQNPPMIQGVDNRFVQDEGLYNYFHELHNGYAAAHAANQLQTDYDEESIVEGAVVQPVGDGSGKF